MKTVLEQMLDTYETRTIEDKKNALKEVVQEAALCGLSRAGFFRTAAFYGGTALRVFYGLDRFSEDLDFSLTEPDADFQLKRYFSCLESELASLGLNFSIEEKQKMADSAVKSAFLKGNTREHILSVYGLQNAGVGATELIKIKFEIDTDPPPYVWFENKYRLLPSPYQVKLYDMPSLFAGKIHAVLCRAWKNRVKGRDLYDYVFYLAKKTKVNLPHLKARLVASGFMNESDAFDREMLISMLNDRFESIDFEQAKQDVLPFVKNASALDLWGAEMFKDITKGIEGAKG